MSQTQRFSTYRLVITALFAAFIAIGAFIKIPLGPVPFSMQFLFCALAGVLLKKEWAFQAVMIYILIGLIGVPVFTNGGGIGYILQPTFGYLIGFMLAAYVIGFVLEKLGESKLIHYFIATVCGLVVVYILGIAHLYGILNLLKAKDLTFSAILNIGFLPFILPDLVWSVLVAILAFQIKPRLTRAGL